MASSKKKTGKRSSPKMRVTRRVVNSKRHTQGYMIGGQFYTVPDSTNLVARGRVSGVRVVGNHIQAESGRKRLSDLPTTVQKVR